MRLPPGVGSALSGNQPTSGSHMYRYVTLGPFKIALKKKFSPQRCVVFVLFSFELVLMTQLLCLKAIYLDDRYVDGTG